MKSDRFPTHRHAFQLAAIFLFTIISIVGPEGLRAQEVGATLSGTVIDANGGGIPSTNIEVTN